MAYDAPIGCTAYDRVVVIACTAYDAVVGCTACGGVVEIGCLHAADEVAPFAVVYDPCKHTLHTLCPSEENVPALQVWQAPEETAPVSRQGFRNSWHWHCWQHER